VDSGALYRAVTAAALRAEVAPEAWTPTHVLAAAERVTLSASDVSFVPCIDGQNAEQEIRGGDVTRHVSRVAQMQDVREWVNARVRGVAEEFDVVVDGRDMGTAVFPDADVKVYLVADPWERAKRRLAQRLGRRPSDEDIAEETDRLVHRDALDAIQSPQARDAVLLDTTYITQREQVDRVVALARAVSQRGTEGSSVENDVEPD
jgi:cytidylate kinase